MMKDISSSSIEDNNELEDNPIGFLGCNSTRSHSRDCADAFTGAGAVGQNG